MVIEIWKSQGIFQSSVSFFGQFFHDNCLFFEVFEIVTRTNAYLILTSFQKLKPMIFGF